MNKPSTRAQYEVHFNLFINFPLWFGFKRHGIAMCIGWCNVSRRCKKRQAKNETEKVVQYSSASFQLLRNAWRRWRSRAQIPRTTMNTRISRVNPTTRTEMRISGEAAITTRTTTTTWTRTATASTWELISITIRKQVGTEEIISIGAMIDATQALISSRTMIITTSITETTLTADEIIMMVVTTTPVTRMLSTKEIGLASCNVFSRNWKW